MTEQSTFGESNSRSKNASSDKIHENIEYQNNSNNFENINSSNHLCESNINNNSVYSYSKNSIENMRRLSTEGSEYSSRCPSGNIAFHLHKLKQ